MDQWIFMIPAIIVAAASLLQQAEGSEKLRSKREALNYEETRVISSTNNDYDDNPSWGYAKPKLTCYSCYRSIDGDDCVTLKDTSKLVEQSCEGEHDQCMVHRLMENDELTTFKRGCAPSCKPGCRAAGVNFVYEECRSCCHDSLCNTGGGASRTLPLKITFLLFAVTTMIFMIV